MLIKLFIVTYVIQIYWKDVNTVSVPIIWPDGNSNYYNNNVYSNRLNGNLATTAYANRRNENIYNRPNADFNRLLFSKLFNFGQTSDPQQTIDAVDFNDKPETPINNAITAPPPDQDDYDDSETATTTTTTTTTTQTPPIVQVDEIQDANNSQRGWRRKRPCVPIPFTHRIGRQANQYNSGSSGRTIFNVYYSNVDGHNHGSGSQNDKPLYDSYGGYICAPNYGNHHHQNNRPQRPQHSNNNNNGGGLGFFGPGGLFDFSNNNSGGSSSSSSTGVLADSVSDTVKPVVEVNVQDTVQDVQQLSWRPLVGGIASTVNGFIQQITNNPNQAVRQINREIYSYIRPIRRFF